MTPCSLVGGYQGSEEEDVRVYTTDVETPDIYQSKHSPSFINPRNSLPLPVEPKIGPCAVTNKSILHPPMLLVFVLRSF
jgi:hypothetical protein